MTSLNTLFCTTNIRIPVFSLHDLIKGKQYNLAWEEPNNVCFYNSFILLRINFSATVIAAPLWLHIHSFKTTHTSVVVCSLIHRETPRLSSWETSCRSWITCSLQTLPGSLRAQWRNILPRCCSVLGARRDFGLFCRRLSGNPNVNVMFGHQVNFHALIIFLLLVCVCVYL